MGTYAGLLSEVCLCFEVELLVVEGSMLEVLRLFLGIEYIAHESLPLKC